MFEGLVIPLIGALVLVGWLAPAAWALRPSHTQRADAVLAGGPAAGPAGGPAGGTAAVSAGGPSADDAPHSGGPTHGATAHPHRSLADAKVARALTRSGLLGVPLTLLTGFLAVRLLFDLPGWFQLAWVAGILMAGFAMWRFVLLWPTDGREQNLRQVVAAHGMRPVGPPWAMIITGLVILALWIVPPFLF